MYGGPTLIDRCRRVAIDYQDYLHQGKYWVGLARRQPWPSPNEPALHLPTTIRIPGLLLMVHVHKCVPCFPHPEGDIFTNHRRYRGMPTQEYLHLVRAKAYFLYYEADISGSLFESNQSYRVVALCRQVQQNRYSQPRQGDVLYPEEVLNYEPVWIGSTTAVTPSVGSTHRIQIVRCY